MQWVQKGGTGHMDSTKVRHGPIGYRLLKVLPLSSVVWRPYLFLKFSSHLLLDWHFIFAGIIKVLTWQLCVLYLLGWLRLYFFPGVGSLSKRAELKQISLCVNLRKCLCHLCNLGAILAVLTFASMGLNKWHLHNNYKI